MPAAVRVVPCQSTHRPLIECRCYRNAGICYSRDLIEHWEKHHELSMKFLTAFEQVKIPKMILKTMKTSTAMCGLLAKASPIIGSIAES